MLKWVEAFCFLKSAYRIRDLIERKRYRNFFFYRQYYSVSLKVWFSLSFENVLKARSIFLYTNYNRSTELRVMVVERIWAP